MPLKWNIQALIRQDISSWCNNRFFIIIVICWEYKIIFMLKKEKLFFFKEIYKSISLNNIINTFSFLGWLKKIKHYLTIIKIIFNDKVEYLNEISYLYFYNYLWINQLKILFHASDRTKKSHLRWRWFSMWVIIKLFRI